MIVAKSLGTLDMTKKTLAGIPYGIASFDEFRAENLAYADKTQAIEVLESRGKFPLLVRPRRFGKSYTANMLSAYYSKGCDSQELFSSLAVAKNSAYREYLNKFDVIHFDLQ